MDRKRAENFMKNIWIWDFDNLKPTFLEKVKAIKSTIEWKKAKDKLKI